MIEHFMAQSLYRSELYDSKVIWSDICCDVFVTEPPSDVQTDQRS